MLDTLQNFVDYVNPFHAKAERAVVASDLDLKNPKDWAWWINNGSGSVSVTPENVFKVSAAYACIKAKSEDIAMLGWDVLKRTANGREIAHNHDQYFLLHDEPNPDTSSFDFRRSLISYFMSWGNGVATIERNKFDRPISYHLRQPNFFQGFKDGDQGEVYYKDFKTGEIFDPFNVVHIKGFDFGEVWAPSVASLHKHIHSIGLSLNTFGANFWKNGTHLRGVIEVPDYIEDDEDVERLRSSFKEKYSGVEKTAEIGILFGGAKYTVLDMKLSDAQYIEFGNHTGETICGIYGVPPHRVGLLGRSTNNNIEKQHDEYVQFGLQPTIINLEQEINRKAIRLAERGIVFNKINIGGLLRGDSKAQAAFIGEMMKWGIYELDDAREYIGANPMPNGLGKKAFVPGNYNPLDRLNEIIDAMIEGKLKKSDGNSSSSTEGKD